MSKNENSEPASEVGGVNPNDLLVSDDELNEAEKFVISAIWSNNKVHGYSIGSIREVVRDKFGKNVDDALVQIYKD